MISQATRPTLTPADRRLLAEALARLALAWWQAKGARLAAERRAAEEARRGE